MDLFADFVCLKRGSHGFGDKFMRNMANYGCHHGFLSMFMYFRNIVGG